ncbi:hypothetical protein [Streptomyces sp. NPDC050255]|uniref:hypothetical protein n=1 Tax=Streptomyces sp. NPDC050255 TaxID=3365606 RepID=UPI003791EEE1
MPDSGLPPGRAAAFADIHQDALPVLDQAQKWLTGIMKTTSADDGANSVGLFAYTASNTAYGGAKLAF